MMKMSKLNIRKVAPGDADKAVGFIRKLGEYQNMSDATVITELQFKKLIESGTGEAIFGEVDDDPVAFMYYYGNSSAFTGQKGLYIDVFYVDEEYRGCGIGKEMLSYMAKLALKRGCGRLEWLCMDWNEPSIRFYKNSGARSMDILTVYRMDQDTMKKII